MLGNHHARLDFQARDHGRLQALGRRFDFLHDTVNAIPEAKALFQGFQVNIRGAQLERVHNDLIHQADERGIGFQVRAGIGFRHPDIFIGEFLDDVLEGSVRHRFLLAAVILAQRGLDIRF